MAGLRIEDPELHTLLVQRLEILDEGEFERARKMATRLRIPLERAVIERGRVPVNFILTHVAEMWGVGFVDLRVSDVKPEALALPAEEDARQHVLLPFDVEDDRLNVAMWNPRDRQAIDEIERTTRHRVVPYLAPESAILRGHLLYRGNLREMLERAVADETLKVAQQQRSVAERSTAELLTRILEYAAVTRPSDIHIEPYELEALVRYRIDGALREVLSLPSTVLAPLVARIKILGQLRIDERRAPQDGRFEADRGGYKVDLRLSTLPTLWGEKIVMRVLSRESILIDLEDLGLTTHDYQIVLRNR